MQSVNCGERLQEMSVSGKNEYSINIYGISLLLCCNPQVLYNAAAAYCQMGQWEQAREVLLSVTQERGGARVGAIEVALDSVLVSVAIFRTDYQRLKLQCIQRDLTPSSILRFLFVKLNISRRRLLLPMVVQPVFRFRGQ